MLFQAGLSQPMPSQATQARPQQLRPRRLRSSGLERRRLRPPCLRPTQFRPLFLTTSDNVHAPESPPAAQFPYINIIPIMRSSTLAGSMGDVKRVGGDWRRLGRNLRGVGGVGGGGGVRGGRARVCAAADCGTCAWRLLLGTDESRCLGKKNDG